MKIHAARIAAHLVLPAGADQRAEQHQRKSNVRDRRTGLGKIAFQNAADVRGVRYESEAPKSTLYCLPQSGVEIHLFTHLVVREDAHILFGFGTERENLVPDAKGNDKWPTP